MDRRNSLRSFSFANRAAKAREEQALLFGDVEHADEERETDGGDPPDPHADLPIYATIHKIRHGIIEKIGMWVLGAVDVEGYCVLS